MQTTCRVFSGIIILAQCFGMLPMIHVRCQNINSLSFEWKSCRFVHAIIIMLLLMINLMFYVIRVAEIGLTFNSTVTLMFFGFGPMSAMLLMQLAQKWPAIMRQWTEVDVKMESYGFPSNLKRKLYTTAVLVMGASLVEHSFFMTFALTNSADVKRASSAWEGLNCYLSGSGSHVFNYVPYNPVFGLVYKLTDITITFVWNYMDMFIMTIAIALAARFRQVSERIENMLNNIDQLNAEAEKQDGGLWMGIREDYNRLCRLTAVIDEALAYIIVLSFANNIFLILVQLLHSIEPQEKTSVVDRLYFAYSFGFLILRTSTVATTSSQIYVESRRPFSYLTTLLPQVYYDNEVERLLMQIRATGGCFLTGNGFFKVKTSLILSIAGSIVSYELIFIQFNLLS